MNGEQLERIRSWASETQRKLHNRSGGDRDSHDLCDLDAALEAALALSREVDRLKLELSHERTRVVGEWVKVERGPCGVRRHAGDCNCGGTGGDR